MILSPSTLASLIEIVKRDTGIALGPEKHYLLQHRLDPVLKAHGLASFEQLLARLASRGSESLRLDVIDAVAIHETSFFRDPEVFAAISTHVLAPALASNARSIRIWSAATSTGQELWSLAMLVVELLGARSHSLESRATIIGSDISPHAIETARLGRYSAAEMSRGLTVERTRAHFSPVPNTTSHQVSDAMRSLGRFRTFNLLDPLAALGKFDLVLCRNVLIYFDEATRSRVLHALADAVLPGGCLVLGAAESLFAFGIVADTGGVPIAAKLDAVTLPRAILYRRRPA